MVKMKLPKLKVRLTRTVLLPNKLSDLLALALHDLKKAERSLHYTIDMHAYHEPRRSGKICAVCLAGSVMAFSLKAARDAEVFPDSFQENVNQLHALDELRCGLVGNAARYLRIPKYRKYEKLNRLVPPYDTKNPKEFHADMKQLYEDLRKAGL